MFAPPMEIAFGETPTASAGALSSQGTSPAAADRVYRRCRRCPHRSALHKVSSRRRQARKGVSLLPYASSRATRCRFVTRSLPERTVTNTREPSPLKTIPPGCPPIGTAARAGRFASDRCARRRLRRLRPHRSCRRSKRRCTQDTNPSETRSAAHFARARRHRAARRRLLPVRARARVRPSGRPNAPGSAIDATFVESGTRYRLSAGGLYPDSTTASVESSADAAMPCGIVPVCAIAPGAGLRTQPFGSVTGGGCAET